MDQVSRPRASSGTTGRKASAAREPKVWFADVGGYRVFGSPVRPVHVTEQQIDEALASL